MNAVKINVQIARFILMAEPQILYSFTNHLNCDRISFSVRSVDYEEMIKRLYGTIPFFDSKDLTIVKRR